MILNIQISKFTGSVFGFFVLIVGLMNLFKGNDPGLGITFILLSMIYFPPLNIALRDLFAIGIPYYIKAFSLYHYLDHLGGRRDS